MIQLKTKYDCCGCEACIQTCPAKCISFSEDAEGFGYPVVNEQACVGCGLCDTVCPVLNALEPAAPMSVLAARNKLEEDLLNSSSGGIFVALARKVLQDNGVVYGAAFSPDFQTVNHKGIEKYEDLPALMGSKYLQSRIGNCFSDIKACLDGKRKVLFCGTGCQVKALKLFLKKEYANLVAVDFICHGVPSPAVWRSYLKQSIQDKSIKSISFRDKRSGWIYYSFTLKTAGPSGNTVQEISQPYTRNPYLWLFMNDYSLRPSCFHCPAKNGGSHSDITIGDYWGIEDSHPSFFDEKGVGLLMVNTTKGQEIISDLDLDMLATSLEEAVLENPTYLYSRKEPAKRADFFRKFSAGTPVNSLYGIYKRKKSISQIPVFFKKKINAIKKRLP